jgi:pimeloyl-ACP methyl ester carboxylesterase
MFETTLALKFSDLELETGVRLRYAERGDPAGHPVIMLHGYTDSWFSFSGVLPHFDADFRIYLPDQRGHGDSERPEGAYTTPEFAADVVALMDAKGLERATVVGHSMGSFVAQQVALMAPHRVERLVLIGSATTIRNEATLELQRSLETLTDPVPAQFARDFQESTVYRSLPEGFMDRAVAESLKLPARVWRAVLGGLLAGDCRDRLGEIRTPALILWGERDSFFSRAEQDALAAGLPNARLKVYPGTGHALHWEQPAQFARDLGQFLAQP